MEIEKCQCVECQESETPCDCDCDKEDACRGCRESREEREEQDFESDWALGRR